MSTTDNVVTPARKPLRLRPALILAGLLLGVRLLIPVVDPEGAMNGVLGGAVLGFAIGIWWLVFSRAPHLERWAALVVIVAAVFATSFVVHESIRNAMMGMMLAIYSVPFMAVALVAGAYIGRHRSTSGRLTAIAVAVLIVCGGWTLVRTDGIRGAGGAQITWRWTPTAEQQLLARQSDEPVTPPAPVAQAPAPTTGAAPATAPEPPAAALEPTPSLASAETVTDPTRPDRTRAEWPGFRGPERDGVVRGIRIATDWAASPPVAIWKRPVGPGWSSFAVRGDLLYTQEQRGDDEVVTSYRVSTGEPVWRHRDAARFWESNGGAGPRATPTLHGDRVYAFGATGILNALDAKTGAVAWSRNVATDAGRQVPGWGFSSSPLVIDDLVIVAASGTLAAYDLGSGKLRWTSPAQLGSYSSPHFATIGGVPQVLLLSGSGATSVDPKSGTVLWHHAWEAGGASIVQPALLANGDVLVNGQSMMGGLGLRRLSVTHRDNQWSVEERWTSGGLKPYFNDFVLHKGYAFGFDSRILSCIDLESGERKWKGGRYGQGQMVLLAEQDLLLVVSEDGELALVKATADQFTEIARVPAIEGKTWNHPVVVGDVALIRNDQEMAAFRLPSGK
jgi:outer membrane protein assembly factor BamB